eukprot:m.49252 g.49252  ORF g.49252 m.49252 type:complete len:456 (+) comp13349_c1_seq9:118-1485(+)
MNRHRCDRDKDYAAQHFAEFYTHLCAKQGTFPVAAMRAHKAKMSDVLLTICVDRLTEQDWYPLLSALKINTRLQKITIESRWSHLRRQAARQRRKQRSQPSRHNRGLIPPSLQQRPLIHHPSAADDLARCLKCMLLNNRQLQSLELIGLPLLQRHALQLADAVAHHPKLMAIALRDCSLDDDAMQVVGGMLQSSNSIMTADLSYNPFTERGCRSIAQAIKAHNAKRGAQSWQQTLRDEPTDAHSMQGLRALDLSYCRHIKDAGGVELAQALDDDNWLLSLNLSNCGLTAVTAKAMTVTLVNNTGLMELKLKGNKITKGLKSRIAKVMALNRAEFVGPDDALVQRAYQDMHHMVDGLSALRHSDSRSRSVSHHSLEQDEDLAVSVSASIATDASAVLDELEFQLDDLATDGLFETQDTEAAEIESTIRKLHALVDKLQDFQAQELAQSTDQHLDNS